MRVPAAPSTVLRACEVVQPFGAYLGEGNVAVEGGVMGEEYALASALAKESLHAVTARYEG